MSIPVQETESKVAFTPGPETWSPEQRGRALHFIWVLANSLVTEWRSKSDLYEALSEFRSSTTLTKAEGGAG